MANKMKISQIVRLKQMMQRWKTMSLRRRSFTAADDIPTSLGSNRRVRSGSLGHVLLAGTSLHRRRRRSTSAPTTGYSSDQLQTHLPNLQFDAASAGIISDCAVCLDNFRTGDSYRRLPDCNHMFHARCVDPWLIKVPNCPICRSPVRLDSGSSSSVIRDDDYKFLWAVGV